MLSTEGLSQYVNNLLSKFEEEYPNVSVWAEFKSLADSKNHDGNYIFYENGKYHYAYQERGKVYEHKKTVELFELCYWIFADATHSEAFSYASNVGASGDNYRIVAFYKQLDMISVLGTDYRERLAIDIEKHLS